MLNKWRNDREKKQNGTCAVEIKRSEKTNVIKELDETGVLFAT